VEVSNLVGVLYLLVSQIGAFACTVLLPEPIPESVASELGSGVYQTHKQTSPSDKFVTTTLPSYKPLADISSKVTGTIETYPRVS
jgi:hypothetical protein